MWQILLGINFLRKTKFCLKKIDLVSYQTSTEGSVSENVEAIECKKENPYASVFNSGNLLCLSIF